jgi:acetylglutamate synthase
LIRRGERILEFKQFDDASREQARQLLETSFSRRLKPDYFDQLPIECILASESFGAMAIVLRGVDGIPYLDKFAVTPEAQGAGLGAAVWQALVKRCPKLYWRSRVDNPVTPWYFEQTESSYTEKQWVAFTKGLKDFERIRRCKVDSLARPISWLDEENV